MCEQTTAPAQQQKVQTVVAVGGRGVYNPSLCLRHIVIDKECRCPTTFAGDILGAVERTKVYNISGSEICHRVPPLTRTLESWSEKFL